jgi:hypothetical protein
VPTENNDNSHPLPADFGREIMNQPICLWDGLPREPQTSINGGTFVGGNVNHIERHGEPGEFSSDPLCRLM